MKEAEAASFSRSELLVMGGAFAATTLSSCSLPSALSVAQSRSASNPLQLVDPGVVVSEPTGAAIQAAIDSLGSGGGSVYLTATTPYIIDAPVHINANKIKLIGKGEAVTTLQAKKGARLTVPYHAGEFVLLIQDASNITVSNLTVDTINQAHDPGGRVGIGFWNSTNSKILHVTFINNLGGKVYNQGLAINASTGITAEKCLATQARSGINVWECQSFTISNCEVTACEALVPPDFTGGALNLTNSSGGRISECYVHDNKTYGGIFVSGGYGVIISSCRVHKTLPFPTQPGNDGIITNLATQQPGIVVQDCQVMDNSGAGVSAGNSSYVIIKKNTIINSGTLKHGGSGVSLNGSTANTTVTENHISDDRKPSYPGIIAGFSGPEDSTGLIEKNVVRGFGYGVSLGADSSDFNVDNNDLRDNVVCTLDQGTGNAFSGNKCGKGA